jgi:acyl carrier protein
MTTAFYDRVCGIVAVTFGIPTSTIGPSTSPETVEAWDSMGHLSLVLALEQELELEIPPDSVEQMKDVASVVRLLSEIADEARNG